MRHSAEEVPSLHRVAPRYFKLVTSSSFRPFMLISALMMFVLYVTILLTKIVAHVKNHHVHLSIMVPIHYQAMSFGLLREGPTVGHTPGRPVQNHSSGHLGGWAMPWSAEEKLDGQYQRADIPAHARAAHKGLLQRRLEEDLC